MAGVAPIPDLPHLALERGGSPHCGRSLPLMATTVDAPFRIQPSGLVSPEVLDQRGNEVWNLRANGRL